MSLITTSHSRIIVKEKVSEATEGREMSKLRWGLERLEVDKRYKITSFETQSSSPGSNQTKTSVLRFCLLCNCETFMTETFIMLRKKMIEKVKILIRIIYGWPAVISYKSLTIHNDLECFSV